MDRMDNPYQVVTFEKDPAPNACAIRSVKSGHTVLFVRKGHEASDEAELKKQVIDNDSANQTLIVSMNGGPELAVFNPFAGVDAPFHFLAVI